MTFPPQKKTKTNKKKIKNKGLFFGETDHQWKYLQSKIFLFSFLNVFFPQNQIFISRKTNVYIYEKTKLTHTQIPESLK